MKENNRFLKKFEDKGKLDLENYIENPSLYEPLAVEAAKWLLENKDFEKRNIQQKEEPELVEKAFFKNKTLSTLVKILLLCYSLILLFVSFFKPSFYSIIWTIIMGASFAVVVSKHKKTVKYLKLLSILALMVLTIQYVLYIAVSYYNGTEINLLEHFSKDYKIVVASLLMIFLGESLIETRYVPK